MKEVRTKSQDFLKFKESFLRYNPKDPRLRTLKLVKNQKTMEIFKFNRQFLNCGKFSESFEWIMEKRI